MDATTPKSIVIHAAEPPLFELGNRVSIGNDPTVWEVIEIERSQRGCEPAVRKYRLIPYLLPA